MAKRQKTKRADKEKREGPAPENRYQRKQSEPLPEDITTFDQSTTDREPTEPSAFHRKTFDMRARDIQIDHGMELITPAYKKAGTISQLKIWLPTGDQTDIKFPRPNDLHWLKLNHFYCCLHLKKEGQSYILSRLMGPKNNLKNTQQQIDLAPHNNINSVKSIILRWNQIAEGRALDKIQVPGQETCPEAHLVITP